MKASKISVIGAGNVGATVAYTLSISGVAADITLIDVFKEKAEGEIMDIDHAASMLRTAHYQTGEYDAITGSDIVVITAGMGRKPGMTRIDLCNTNIKIIKDIIPQIVKYAPDAIYLVVSNPADILTYAALKLSGLPETQIIGSGTLLDGSRLRSMLAHELKLNARSVHAMVLGEHGDSSMIPWSLVNVLGMDIGAYTRANNLPALSPEKLDEIAQAMRKGGASVISRKGATFYAIAASVREICSAIIYDSRRIFPVCTMLHGEYGIEDVALSIPCNIGREGIHRKIMLEMLPEEVLQLQASGDALKKVLAELDI